MKSKYGPGGEFEPDWCVLLLIDRFSFSYLPSSYRTPPGPPPVVPQPPLDTVPPIPDPTEPPIIRPAWRAYHPRTRKKKKEPKVAPVAAQPPQAGPSHMGPAHMDRHLRQQVTSWSTWHRKFLALISIYIMYL